MEEKKEKAIAICENLDGTVREIEIEMLTHRVHIMDPLVENDEIVGTIQTTYTLHEGNRYRYTGRQVHRKETKT